MPSRVVPAEPLVLMTASCRACGRTRPQGAERCGWCGTLDRSSTCEDHPDRVSSEACVICGRAVCPDCRHGPRLGALCEDHVTLRLLSGWAEIRRFSDELDAELVAGVLRGAGIEAQVFSQKDRANVVTFGGLSIVRVLVPPFRYEEAERLLHDEGITPGA